jgi:hypothetical protein
VDEFLRRSRRGFRVAGGPGLRGAFCKVPHLPARAGATIATLILIPVCKYGRADPATGHRLKVWSAYRAIADGARAQRPVWESVSETLLGQIQVLPFIAGGVLLTRGDASGFYWVAGGVIAVFVFSVFNGWVLLVEILR